MTHDASQGLTQNEAQQCALSSASLAVGVVGTRQRAARTPVSSGVVASVEYVETHSKHNKNDEYSKRNPAYHALPVDNMEVLEHTYSHQHS